MTPDLTLITWYDKDGVKHVNGMGAILPDDLHIEDEWIEE